MWIQLNWEGKWQCKYWNNGIKAPTTLGNNTLQPCAAPWDAGISQWNLAQNCNYQLPASGLPYADWCYIAYLVKWYRENHFFCEFGSELGSLWRLLKAIDIGCRKIKAEYSTRSGKVASWYAAAVVSKNSAIAACGDPVRAYPTWHPYTYMLRCGLLHDWCSGV